RVDAGQQRVVIQHLLEMRDDPVRIDAVTGEAARELVVHAAPCHCSGCRLSHQQRLLRVRPGSPLGVAGPEPPPPPPPGPPPPPATPPRPARTPPPSSATAAWLPASSPLPPSPSGPPASPGRAGTTAARSARAAAICLAWLRTWLRSSCQACATPSTSRW